MVAERKSKQDPPPAVIFDSLVSVGGVGEERIWWVSVEGEREPVVIDAERPQRVTYASPFLWRPSDVVELSLEPLGQGCKIHLRHTSDEPAVPLEAAALRHRWGEHIDRDLRDRWDCGGRPEPYQVSLYRGDVDDWTIVERVVDKSWRVVERLPVQIRSGAPGGWPSEHELEPGDIIWAIQMGRHRTSVVCLPEAPPDLEARITGGALNRGVEIFVPLPEFGRRLQPI